MVAPIFPDWRLRRSGIIKVIGKFVAEADGCFVGSTGESGLQGGDIFTLGLCELEATTIELSS